MPKLNWKLLIKKRGSSTTGLPPGKEDLAWVSNAVTLIYGERDAVLVDAFLSEKHSKELVGLDRLECQVGRFSRQRPYSCSKGSAA